MDRANLEHIGVAVDSALAPRHWALIVVDGQDVATLGNSEPGVLLAVMEAAVAKMKALGVEPTEGVVDLDYIAGLEH